MGKIKEFFKTRKKKLKEKIELQTLERIKVLNNYRQDAYQEMGYKPPTEKDLIDQSWVDLEILKQTREAFALLNEKHNKLIARYSEVHSKYFKVLREKENLVSALKEVVTNHSAVPVYKYLNNNITTILQERWVIDFDFKLILPNPVLNNVNKITYSEFYQALVNRFEATKLPVYFYTEPSGTIVIKPINGWDVLGEEKLVGGTLLRSN